MNIQIFGTKKCNDTKKAQRFFKERGIKFQFIDMAENTPFLTSKLPATCVLLALISHPISPSPSILPFSLSLAHQPFHASVPLLILVMSRGWGCLNPLAKSYPSCKPQPETEDNVGFLGTEGFLHPVSCL